MILHNFLTSGHQFGEQESYLAFRFRVANYFMLVAVVFGLLIGLLGCFHIMKIGLLQSSADIIYAFINIILIWQLRTDRKKFIKIIWVQVSASWLLFLVALITVSNDEFRAVWFFIAIYIAFMMLGVKSGVFFTLLSISSLLLVDAFSDINISETAVLTAIFSMLVFGLLSRAYSMQMHGYEKKLEAQNRELEKNIVEINKALTSARAANQIKTLFLANISHEIRTPMHGMLTMTQVLKKTELQDQQQRYLGSIERAGHTLLRLIDDLLDLSVIESGKLEISNREFNTRECIDDLLAQIKPLFDGHAAQLYFDADDLPPCFIGDEVRIKQVIINLASNAARYTRTGEVRVMISGRQLGSHDWQVEIAVADTGVGIAPENLQKIFEPFQQIVEDRIAEKGAGLGLAICKRIVDAMSGELQVMSEEGKGSTFTVRLVLQSGQLTPDVTDNTEQLSYTKEMNILLVDDDAISRFAMNSLLSGEGHHVLTAKNGVEAIEVLKKGAQVDVILMDIHMPEMNGVMATEIIKRDRLTNAPIIGISASVMSNECESYMAAGMDSLVEKPLDFARLMDVVSRKVVR